VQHRFNNVFEAGKGAFFLQVFGKLNIKLTFETVDMHLQEEAKCDLTLQDVESFLRCIER